MSGFLSFFVPKDRKFYPLFEKSASNLVEVTKVLTQLVNAGPEKRKELTKEVERLEHIGDSHTHEIFNELAASFITPFDREDIHALATAIDDIVDFIHGSVKRIELYNLQTITPEMIKLAELLEKQAAELSSSINELRNLKNTQKIKECSIRINALENHADDIFDMALGKLFESEKNAIELIKVKEILSALETATDKCDDAADVIDSIIIKHA